MLQIKLDHNELLYAVRVSARDARRGKRMNEKTEEKW